MRDVWEGKKKRNRVGEGKVERAEGVLTLESPPRASGTGVEIGFV